MRNEARYATSVKCFSNQFIQYSLKLFILPRLQVLPIFVDHKKLNETTFFVITMAEFYSLARRYCHCLRPSVLLFVRLSVRMRFPHDKDFQIFLNSREYKFQLQRWNSILGYRNWPRYGLRRSGWYCNPAQHELCRPSRGRFLFYHDHNFKKSKGNLRFRHLVPLFVPIGVCVTTHDDGTASDVTIGLWRHNQQATNHERNGKPWFSLPR